MADSFIGEIRAFCFNFAPQGWAFCNGQTLHVTQNMALYSIIGTTFGGDNMTFKLPNLGGQAVMGQVGNVLNNPMGAETVKITAESMPSHIHELKGSSITPTTALPTGHLPGRFLEAGNTICIPKGEVTKKTILSPKSIQLTGEGLPHENRQPYQVFNFCIALTGIYPARP